MRKCWETKLWDEGFLFHGLSYGFVINTNEENLEFFGCFFRLMTFLVHYLTFNHLNSFITQGAATYEFTG